MALRQAVVDDIDGTEPARKVRFGYDGRNYEIDLNRENEKVLRDALAIFISHAKCTNPKTGRSKPKVRKGSSADFGSPAAIRAWANENGYRLAERGKLPQEVRDAYDRAFRTEDV